MKVYFASYPSIFLNRGGPTYKIFHLKKALEQLGVEVKLFDPWDEKLKINRDELVHIFNASLATYTLACNLHDYGARFVVNPIFFSNHQATAIRRYLWLEKIAGKVLKRSSSDYFFTARICELAAAVLPNTSEEAALLEKGLGIAPEKMMIWPNGVEARFHQADPGLFRQKFGISDFVLYVGHLGPVRKNGLNILRALQGLDVPAVVIADILNTPEGEQCRSLLKESSNILFIPWLDHDDPLLESAYAACRTFVLATRYETPGRAALEAALAGAGIVITPYGGTRDYFQDMALYAEPDDIRDIRRKVILSLESPKDNTLREHILARFTWEIIARDTLAIYKKLLDQ